MNAGIETDTVDSDSKTFISKLLGEMKNQFNRTENVVGEQSDSMEQLLESQELTTEVPSSCSGNNQSSIMKGKSAEVFQKSLADDHIYVKETMKSEMNIKGNLINFKGRGLEADCDHGKSKISVHFKKPYPATTSVKTDESPVGRRSLRNKSNSVEEKIGESTLKRSARRSKDGNESVLQSAIARKEKSYNESNKPQRLSRLLKPTSKVLEHVAISKNEKSKSSRTDDKRKPDSDCVDNKNPVVKKKIVKYKTVRRKAKCLRYYKNNDSNKEVDSDVDSNKICNSIETSDVFQHPRRISCSKDDSIMGDESSSEGENSEILASHEANVERSLVTSQLISSRLCLCTKKMQLYPVTDDQLYCGAIDSLGEKLVGCTRIVNRDMPLLRPSYRVPYTLYCVVHKNRMIRHNCCPTCGIFCTQGRFTQCELLHQYHRACQISVGDIECCPHCGSSTPKHDIYITMYSSKKPAFLLSKEDKVGCHFPTRWSTSLLHCKCSSERARWMGRRGPIEWPARSPDLTPMEFFYGVI